MTTFAALGADTADTTGVSVTAGDNAKGSWFELSSSLPFDVEMIYLYVTNIGTDTASAYAIDVGTGAGGSETAQIENVLKVTARGREGSFYPLRVDPTVFSSGTRLAVRAEGSSGGGTRILDIIALVASAEPPAISGADSLTYGVSLGADAKGTSLDPGGTANTKSSYVELTSSFSATGQIFWLLVFGDQNSALTSGEFFIDIAQGAAASETVVVPNIAVAASDQMDKLMPDIIGPFKADDLQGNRVAARIQSNIIDAVDRIVRVALLVATGTEAAGGTTIYSGVNTVNIMGRAGMVPSGPSWR